MLLVILLSLLVRALLLVPSPLTILALFGTIWFKSGIIQEGINIAEPAVMAGLFIMECRHFFSSMAMSAVGRAKQCQ